MLQQSEAAETSAEIAVDPSGNLYYTDEDKNQILRITRNELLGNGSSEIIYDGARVTGLRSPGGLGVDSFRVYWVNKQQGTELGSLVRAPKIPMAGETMGSDLEALTKNTDKSYGVCLATRNVLYTQPERQLYGVPKTGDGVGGFVTVNNKLKNPRGCVYDGDSTVYVADRGAGAIYSFPETSAQLTPSQATKFADLSDAFGVALFSGALRHSSGLLLWLATLAGIVLAAQ
eukprot:TRINITY_DN22283_c0_g1_i1.p1 TRINITY_DN22283_c0_g1~~TRINITY_DN22283_c0_g1_i1.p1  ORF type:complete len:231 (-),score=47.22 TRINITY_DN22283_c0_g1_i1:25-717(-)